MKFVDEAVIKVSAGDGGAGCRHFRRETFVPLGGPDGGNGGDGGNVILIADTSRQTLLDFRYQAIWEAEDGKPGQGSMKEGKSGKDLVISLPVGTEIYKLRGADFDMALEDAEDLPRELVADLIEPGQEFVLAKGGRGGKGNDFFKTSTNRAPEQFQPGEEAQSGIFVFSLKLVADVGLIGFPNAGKSTLISRISAARPKIADYPFTTLTPNLGVARAKGGRSFVVADIPGLIPGAHEGKGLGIQFLKHTERTRLLAHLIDPFQFNGEGQPQDPLESYEMINHELKMFSKDLAARPQIVVITKIDAISDRSELTAIMEKFQKRGLPCLAISSVSGEGIEELLEELFQKSRG